MMEYQYNYSQIDPILYNIEGREQKAKKIIAVLSDYFGTDLKHMKLLDIGSSTGIMTRFLSESFDETIGVDIDVKGVEYAKKNFESEKLHFELGDSMSLQFSDNSFDVINCTQVYEHVPDSKILMAEIYRILKPGGICYFSAGNRLVLIEGHYNLPLLSVFPKRMAHCYLRILKKGSYYYEKHLTYWGLKRLTSNFERIDYTGKIIADPIKYSATEMIRQGSIKQRVAKIILRVAYWIFPDYIWLLKKPLDV